MDNTTKVRVERWEFQFVSIAAEQKGDDAVFGATQELNILIGEIGAVA